ncbi:Isochorismatase hydrolase [Colletotrichum zoysiae]|uniref:Isochorismatase hydrolase n=1 Tax=Colletotrichum zoysiae TaxID=1216348 RepID=A0AAD9HDG2_9PEZI|nr:Isochorismatase hydrolase [Colletotrichum zoysiae]
MRAASTTPTTLVLIDIKEDFKHLTHWDNPCSTLSGDSALAPERRPVLVIQVHHHSNSPTSAPHPSHYLEGSSWPSVAPLPFAAPLISDPIVTKNFNSGFVGTAIESTLRSAGIRQFVLVGLRTDHCVSTTARMADNLQVLGDDGGPDANGEGVHGIVLVRDATATYEKGGFDAETLFKELLGMGSHP